MRGSAVLTSATLATIVALFPLLLASAQAPNNSHANANNGGENPVDLIPVLETNTIPYYDPGGGPATLVLDPLAPASTPAPVVRRSRRKKPKRLESGDHEDDNDNTTDSNCTTSSSNSTLCPSSSSPPPPSPSPTPTPSQTLPPMVPGSQCTANYTYGPIAVSVEGGGTFCAFAPVCSGTFLGKCPGLQPGLGGPSRCEIVDGGVYGCVP